MATEQEILIKSNSADASAVPTSLKKKEVAANLLDRSLFGSDGESVFRFYEHPTKYFNEYGFANNALKLGGFLPTYFQKALESGVNIKTINGQNILGAGDIEISGGGNTENLVTKQEVIDNEEVIANALIQHNDKIKKIEDRFPNYPTNEEIANIKQNLDNAIIDNEEVIANALIDINTRVKGIEEPSILTISGTSIILRSGQYYIHSGDVDALDISFENQKSTILSHYMLQFTTSSIGCTLSLPNDVKWVNGTTPTINGGKTYQLSILNNFAICVEYE